MEKDFGYTLMKFNYITDYAKAIEEKTVEMKFIWHNRNHFADNVDVPKIMEDYRKEIKRMNDDFLNHLSPHDDFWKDEEKE